MTKVARVCRYDEIVKGDHFYTDLAKGEVAIAASNYARGGGMMQIKFYTGDGEMRIRTFEPAHLTAVLCKPSKAELKGLQALNEIRGAQA